MIDKQPKTLIGIYLVTILILSILIATGLLVESGFAQEGETGPLYLPMVNGREEVVPNFGVEILTDITLEAYHLASDSGTYWVRWGIFDWHKVEATQGIYNWGRVPEDHLDIMLSGNVNLIGTIKNVPDWARPADGHKCGPVAQEAMDEFIEFVQAVVQRYGNEIKYWEIGNEPDFPYQDSTDTQPFGCWGNRNDPSGYWGGGYYGDMLAQVYPAIKAVDPKATVVLGGLLLDCDPTFDSNCEFGKFFEGVLRRSGQWDGGNYFDVVNFHAYPYFNQGIIGDRNDPKWAHRGGVLEGKVEFLKEKMQQYGLNKPLFMTEFSLLCNDEYITCNPPHPNYDAFLQAQADWVIEGFIRSYYQGVEAITWYTMNKGWRNGGLLNDDNSIRPSYTAFQHMAQKLATAEMLGPVPAATNLEGYRFRVSGMEIWVVWARNWNRESATSAAVSIPSGAQRVLDKYGSVVYDIGAVPPTLNVGSPMYIEVQP